MKPEDTRREDIKRSWNGIATLFTICLQRGAFRTIQENQTALNDLAVLEQFIKDTLDGNQSPCPECEKRAHDSTQRPTVITATEET